MRSVLCAVSAYASSVDALLHVMFTAALCSFLHRASSFRSMWPSLSLVQSLSVRLFCLSLFFNFTRCPCPHREFRACLLCVNETTRRRQKGNTRYKERHRASQRCSQLSTLLTDPPTTQAVVDSGAVDALVTCLDEFDPGVKEAAAWALGYIARHNAELAQAVVDAGAVPLLILCVQVCPAEGDGSSASDTSLFSPLISLSLSPPPPYLLLSVSHTLCSPLPRPLSLDL